jgi:hypothetical protein
MRHSQGEGIKSINQQTTEKLHIMRLRGMAEAFTQQHSDFTAASSGVRYPV